MPTTNIIVQFLPYVLLLGLMYFIFFLPEKKRKNAFMKMISELKINDEVTTRGGIMGRIVKLDDETITIESGLARTPIKLTKNSVAGVHSAITE